MDILILMFLLSHDPIYKVFWTDLQGESHDFLILLSVIFPSSEKMLLSIDDVKSIAQNIIDTKSQTEIDVRNFFKYDNEINIIKYIKVFFMIRVRILISTMKKDIFNEEDNNDVDSENNIYELNSNSDNYDVEINNIGYLQNAYDKAKKIVDKYKIILDDFQAIKLYEIASYFLLIFNKFVDDNFETYYEDYDCFDNENCYVKKPKITCKEREQIINDIICLINEMKNKHKKDYQIIIDKKLDDIICKMQNNNIDKCLIDFIIDEIDKIIIE